MKKHVGLIAGAIVLIVALGIAWHTNQPGPALPDPVDEDLAVELVKELAEVAEFFATQEALDTLPGAVVGQLADHPEFYEVTVTSFNEAGTLRTTFGNYWVSAYSGEVFTEQPF